MTPTIRFGRLFGIEIGANWSLAVLSVLVTLSLAATVLPADVPGQPQGAYWVVAVVGAVAFSACLLAHELAHAVTARRRGVRVSGITLWLFGGVSSLEGEPASAGAEALITAVGPLTSLALAGLAAGAAGAAAALGAPALLVDLLAWLAFLNVALALFNLVPAFPLDGGRLLAALFWARTGSRQRGVRGAVAVGRVFAFAMIGLGLVELLFGAVLSGIWIAFIGWFLLTAASAEESAAGTRAQLGSVPVSAAMSSPVVVVPDWLQVEQFLGSLAPGYHFSTYPLHDPGGTLTGVVRLNDLLRAASTGGRERRLAELARPIGRVPTAAPQESLEHLLQRLGSELQHRVLVFEDGRLVGILSPSDVARVAAVRRAVAGHGGAARA